MDNNNFTLIGALVAITTAFLTIFSLIVKYFIDALNRKDVRADVLTDKVIQTTDNVAASNNKLAQSIDVSNELTKTLVEATKSVTEATKSQTDQLSQLFMQAIGKK